MSKRSGHPGRASWEPMRQVQLNPASPLSRAVDEGKHFYIYRNPELKPVRVEAWANRLYNGTLIWFDDTSGHFSFKRNDRSAIRDWRHVQSIKNEIAGPEREAIELYPAESMLVDGANEYHIWILPEGMGSPLGMARREVGKAHSTYDRQAQLQGNPNPGGKQRPWESGLSTGPKGPERT